MELMENLQITQISDEESGISWSKGELLRLMRCHEEKCDLEASTSSV
jgi:hypothetical protein